MIVWWILLGILGANAAFIAVLLLVTYFEGRQKRKGDEK